MSNAPPTYSALSADEQAELSVWIESFEDQFPEEGATRLKQTLEDAPHRLRATLLSQLLPLLIDDHRKRHSATPTLHELRLAHPDLAEDLAGAYALLSPDYRLPIELRGYRVLRVVGEGGQAVVLKAQDDVHSAVAIKLSVSPQHNELLLRERRLLGECHHPGIPEVIASGINEERAFFIMPFLRGMTLADRYANFRPDPAEAARIAGELCSIVAHLHAQGILHRDIKPANVWLDDQGAVKLIDLGMALERTSWGKPLSEIREFHGTPAFMSPEQAASDGGKDGELSDVFSIGATLYWLGTGSPPFEGGTEESVLSKAATGQFDRHQLAEVSGWPKPLVLTCLQAMATDPGQRCRSARAFALALASPQSTRRRFSWKRPLWLAVAATLGVVGWFAATGKLTLFYAAAPAAQGQEPVDDEPVPNVPDNSAQEPGSPHRQAPSVPPAGALGDGEEQSPLFDPKQSELQEDGLTPPSDLPKSPAGMAYVPVQTLLYAPDRPPDIRWHLTEIPNSKVAPSVLSPDLSQDERIKKAKAWLKALPPQTQLGEFVGRRFHPTTLSRIREALTSIRISHSDDPNGGKTYLLGKKSDDYWLINTDQVRSQMLRTVQELDFIDYAYDFRCDLIARPVLDPFTEIPPGWQKLLLTVYFLDGSSISNQSVTNRDRSLAIDLKPIPPLRATPDAKLFLYRTEKVDPSRSVARFLTKPLSKSNPHRDYLLRTNVGFYCAVPPYASRIAVTTDKETVQSPDRIDPGTIYVHLLKRDGRLARRVGYAIPRESLEELANSALYFEESIRKQAFNPDGSRRSP